MNHEPGHVGAACSLAGLSLVLLAAGCVVPAGRPESIAFSPERRHVAWIWTDILYGLNPLPPRACQGCVWPALSQTVRVGWSSSDHAGQVHLLSVYNVGPDRGDHRGAADSVQLAFSTDGSKLGVLTPRGMTVIELPSSQCRPVQLANGLVTSFAWLGDDEIGYVAEHSGGTNGRERTVWRQVVRDSPETRRVIVQNIPGPVGGLAGQRSECWSPQGRYLILQVGPPFAGLFMVDVQAATTEPIEGGFGENWAVAWRHDESAALCMSMGASPERPDTTFKVLLFDPRTRQSLNLAPDFGRLPGPPFRIEPLATAEDSFFIVGIGGPQAAEWLVCPQPWLAVPAAERIAARLNGCPAGTVRLAPSQYPGWILADAQEGHYLSDYLGQQVTKLGTDLCTISPDGRQVAWISRLGSLGVRPLD